MQGKKRKIPQNMGGEMMTERKFDQIKYIQEYNKENYARVSLLVPPEVKADWQTRAKAEGLSITAWLIKKTKKEEPSGSP